jgi:N-acetylneuraminate synthase
MSHFFIGNRAVGQSEVPLVIAEIGINHEGSFEKAIRMIDDIAKEGAECVKLFLLKRKKNSLFLLIRH